MTRLKKETLNNEQGFTLVELAVVMIIIGLLIGGILKGQELITNAKVTKTASDFEALGAAYNGFRDKYNALPGDLRTATTKIGTCATFAACANGNGNGIIDRRFGARPANNESIRFFGQLLAAGFISSMEGSGNGAGNTASFGVTNPTAPIGGGFIVGDTRFPGNPIAFTQPNLLAGTHIMITGSASTNVSNANGVLTNSQAATIDRRLDDGAPWSGTITADDTCDDNVAAPNTAYNEDVANSVCVIAYKM